MESSSACSRRGARRGSIRCWRSRRGEPGEEQTMRDLLRLAIGSVLGHRLRSLLSMVGIAIGIASVILLTSIGEGTRRFMVGQFTQFGTNLIAIHPGKTQTSGIPGIFRGTTRKLTPGDALAVARGPGVQED